MTAPNSELQYYVRRQALKYQGEDFPMSSNQARYTANNLRHLHDVSTQHRVNFQAAIDGDPNWLVFDLSTTYAHVVTYAFPWTFAMDGYPACPVIRVGGSTAANTMTIAAYVNPMTVKASYDSDASTNIFGWTGSTTSTSVEWIIQDNGNSQFNSSYIGYPMLCGYPVNYVEHDGTTPNVRLNMMRLSIYTKVNTGTTSGKIYAVSLRETAYR